MARWANAGLVTAIGLWVGGLAALSLAVAPIVFRTAGSRHLAGTIFGSVLRTFGWIELGLAAAAAACFALSHPSGRTDWARGGMLAIMLCLLAAYSFGTNPAIAELRPQCGSFDREPASDAERAARSRFDRLHAWSVRLVAANILVGLALLAASAARKP